MTDHVCAREVEVVAAVLGRRWASVDEELKAHAAECEICGEVVSLTSLLSAEQERARSEVRVPAAGQVWWRAAVRARLEAAQTAVRPMTWLHGIASACAIGLAVAVGGMVWPWLLALGSWSASQTFGADSHVGDLAGLVIAALQRSLPLAFVVAAFIVLAPVAIYFVLTDD